MIHRGNYEEYFILYMDNELGKEERAAVEGFIEENPDLKAELELLLSTRLPQEQFSFDKHSLKAENMKRATIDEDLLLYIDGELTVPAKNSLELELAANEDFRQKHQLLLRAKLDPSETIVFPEKKSLYRSSGRIGFIRPWMRAAAVLLLIAGTGSLLVLNSPPPISSGNGLPSNQPSARVANPESPSKPSGEIASNIQKPAADKKDASEAAGMETAEVAPRKQITFTSAATKEKERQPKADALAETQKASSLRPVNVIISQPHIDNNDISFSTPVVNKSINNSPVTNLLPERTTGNTAEPAEETASRDRKGSFKGFLRKASRVIERRTGIQPINDDGELLIGMVAVKLK